MFINIGGFRKRSRKKFVFFSFFSFLTDKRRAKMDEIAKKLLKIMDKRGLTQAALAAEVGVSRGSVDRVLEGKYERRGASRLKLIKFVEENEEDGSSSTLNWDDPRLFRNFFVELPEYKEALEELDRDEPIFGPHAESAMRDFQEAWGEIKQMKDFEDFDNTKIMDLFAARIKIISAKKKILSAVDEVWDGTEADAERIIERIRTGEKKAPDGTDDDKSQ
jgi:transcriptional regulator with XRE-family HTH domain